VGLNVKKENNRNFIQERKNFTHSKAKGLCDEYEPLQAQRTRR
jgi:hypothetical protein